MNVRAQPQQHRQQMKLRNYKTMECPRSFLCHLDIVSEFNDWTREERRRALPTAFDDIAAKWYVRLDDGIKQDYTTLRAHFVARFESGIDPHQGTGIPQS